MTNQTATMASPIEMTQPYQWAPVSAVVAVAPRAASSQSSSGCVTSASLTRTAPISSPSVADASRGSEQRDRRLD
jgi:hypothetical protein